MNNRRHILTGVSSAALCSVLAGPALADVVISTGATQNMTCSGGVCAPTASSAILNVNDLEGYLASGNVEVTTTGSGGVQTNNIDIKAALTWSTASALSLVASKAITVDQPVSVTGVGGLSITNDGQNEDFSFGSSGNISFSSLSSSLTINGAAYTLVNTVKGLASAIRANRAGDYALAASYNAKNDRIYRTSPVKTAFSGSFDGLGNTISGVRVHGFAGLFADIEKAGSVANLNLTDTGVRGADAVSDFVYQNRGSITRCYISGGHLSSRLGGGEAGLAVSNFGTIVQSQSSTSIRTRRYGDYGGLVADNYYGGVIEQSFSTGSVTTTKGYAGGLVGLNTGAIIDSYATGRVINYGQTGGLVGVNGSNINTSYSTGKVDAGKYAVGGFIGYNLSGEPSDNDYWDTTTSGHSQGCGTGDCSGVTGLTTQQLQSGLPAEFSPKIWAENPHINNGLPYLIANPPR